MNDYSVEKTIYSEVYISGLLLVQVLLSLQRIRSTIRIRGTIKQQQQGL